MGKRIFRRRRLDEDGLERSRRSGDDDDAMRKLGMN
jgi:hypothetical protein